SASMVVARSVLSALSLRMGLSRPPSTTATQQPDDAEEGPSAVPAVEGEEGGVRAGLGLNPTKAPPPSMQPPAGTQLLDRCPSPTAVVDDGDDTPGARPAGGPPRSRSASPDEITTASSQGSEDVAAVVRREGSPKAWKVEVLEAAPVQEPLPIVPPLVLDLARSQTYSTSPLPPSSTPPVAHRPPPASSNIRPSPSPADRENSDAVLEL
ncbi:hypothetical protein HaLaN_13006, partial [Haematococcus lacustris]